MTTNPTNPKPAIDPELSKLIEQSAALDAQIEKLAPEERKKLFTGNLGLPEDASDEDLQRAIEADILADPAFAGLAEELAQSPNGCTEIFFGEVLDELFLDILVDSLKEYDDLSPAERRTEILSMYDLGADATDKDLEAAIRNYFSELDPPVSPEITQQCVTLFLNKSAT